MASDKDKQSPSPSGHPKLSREEELNLIIESEDFLRKNFGEHAKIIDVGMERFRKMCEGISRTDPSSKSDHIIKNYVLWLKNFNLTFNELEKHIMDERIQIARKQAEKSKELRSLLKTESLILKIDQEIYNMESGQMDQSKLDKLSLLYASKACLEGAIDVTKLREIKGALDGKPSEPTKKPVSKQLQPFERLYSQVIALKDPKILENQNKNKQGISFKTIAEKFTEKVTRPFKK